ncbi:ABC transporter ATP-binding protein [Butyrivibrio sp. XPD2002]|uniref:ABC transporter ATP-binding protein n=1 Tax=Butyrivibrio sp. XPD2002 TaxID=1280665 RepID=UPI000422C11D|nr:ABC transporter ATP-binding protein [Butyrivibrio sp. XPD2002]
MNRNRYTILDNIYFYCRECISFDRIGFLFAVLLIPSKILQSLITIFIPKLVIDSIESHSTEYAFLLRILIITAAMAVTSIAALLTKNTMEHSMNSFVLVRLNRLWAEKASTMDYEVFTSEEGKQSSSKARLMLEGTTRWGIGTYIPRLLDLAISFIGFAIYACLLVSVHPIVLIALLVTYSINLSLTLRAEKKKQLLKDDLAKADRKMNYFAYNTRGLSIAKDIRLYSMKEWITEMTTLARLDTKHIDEKMQDYQLSVLIINSILVFLRDGIVYLILISLTLQGRITIGNFALYAAAVNGLGEWLSQITSGIGAFREADNNVTDFRKFLALTDQDNSSGKDIKLTSAPSIELRNVSFSYNDKTPVLTGISLKVKPGEKIAIVGANGAGKTTLIKLICGLLRPKAGEILINGVGTDTISAKSFADNVSAVFQDSALLPVSIERNITMNDEEADDSKLNRIISLVGLDRKISSLDMGIETPLIKHISENGTELSGGEMQKLLLARAIYKDSPILILDEPTAAMDPIAEQNVYLKYNELSRDKTSFFISHRLSSTRFCDRIILIDGGTIIEIGTHDELMAKRGMYHDMYMLQSKYYQEGDSKAV